jgi:hypothetical protein
MRNLYTTYYIVKVVDSPDNLVWYHKKKGETFETTKIKEKSTEYFCVNYLHRIPCRFCEVIEVKKVLNYQQSFR